MHGDWKESFKIWAYVQLAIFALVGSIWFVVWADADAERQRQARSDKNIKSCQAIHGKVVLSSSWDKEPMPFKECILP